MNRFETVRPADLAVGDVVQGNGALWRILAFEQTRLGQTEMVKVSCVDPQGVRPFEVGFEKQFIRQPRGGTWDRLVKESVVVNEADWARHCAMRDVTGHPADPRNLECGK